MSTQNTIKVTVETDVEVSYLKVDAHVRYWEDSTVNEQEDTDGSLIPFRNGAAWQPIIDLKTGEVVDWPKGTTADIHYKVCDAGSYHICDANQTPVLSKDGYVPNMLCPEENGYGDYIIMHIDENGLIRGFEFDASDFSS